MLRSSSRHAFRLIAILFLANQLVLAEQPIWIETTHGQHLRLESSSIARVYIGPTRSDETDALVLWTLGPRSLDPVAPEPIRDAVVIRQWREIASRSSDWIEVRSSSSLPGAHEYVNRHFVDKVVFTKDGSGALLARRESTSGRSIELGMVTNPRWLQAMRDMVR